MQMTIAEAKKAIETRKTRSAWDRGVTLYALDLLDNLDGYDHSPADRTECKKMLMNGADSWRDYSCGGSALIYDGDIAERLCTPSELKRTRNGEKNPNGREIWLDVQTRALFQAARVVVNTLF